MSTSISNGLVNAEEAQVDTIKPNTGTSVVIQDADGTERMKVDGANIGIGTDSPQRTLHISKTAAADPSYAANQPLIIEDATRPGIQLVGSANNIGLIEFGDNAHPNAGSINFDHSTDRLRFGFTDDAEKVYIDSSGNMVISGDLTVNGDTTTLSTTNSVVEDKLIELGNGVTGTPSGDAGIIIERGSSDNAAIVWDESRDEFVLGTTSATGASTGDLTVTPGNISVERIGAGTEQAEAEVHAKRDVSSGGQYSTTATVIAEDDSRPSIQLVGSANNIGLIQFGDNAAVASGQIYYDHATDKLRVDCGGSGDRVTVDASGNVVAEGSLILKEKAAAVADVAAYGQLWTKSEAPCELYFTNDSGNDIQLTDGSAIALGTTSTSAELNLLDGGTTVGGSVTIADSDGFVLNDAGTMKTIPASDIKTYAGGGTDRYSISERFKIPAIADEARVYFVGDIATDAGQFSTTLYATNGSTVAVDGDWISGFEATSLGWQAPRTVTLTKICCTAKIVASTNMHSMVVNVFKGTPVNNQVYTTDVTLTRVGQATMTNDSSTELSDTFIFTVNTAISSGNSISANDMVVVGFSTIGGNSASTSFANVTLEFEVS